MGFPSLLWSMTCFIHMLSGPVVMLLYPLYASIKAIESESKEDDQQWLTYWILYSSLTFLELVISPVFAWIPLWSSIKLGCALWLVLPPFKGAHRVYDWAIRGRLLKQQAGLTRTLSESQRKFLELLSPQARESLECHIEEHGTHALDNIIAAANKETYKNPFA
ncbi:hypothetical protein GOP47_0025786 [Adiantum capillus-veneris]|uniref:HVA22-like protein n=1 Tax=Adiantum capillus-veneris TaxID=13818 RepID=A0A9D4Z3V4_ADICA|nr:hypothetical protein GOP47_0025786 [Adiantum capillus-veneris]